jgi:hypothetical protein
VQPLLEILDSWLFVGMKAGSLCRFLILFRLECAVVRTRVVIGIQNQSNHVGIYLEEEI